MVRELKDNEKVENLEGAVKDLAVTISELDGNVRQLMRAITRADATPVARAKPAGVKLEDGFSVEDLSTVSYLNIDMHSDKSPTGLTFFDLHAHSIVICIITTCISLCIRCYHYRISDPVRWRVGEHLRQ